MKRLTVLALFLSVSKLIVVVESLELSDNGGYKFSIGIHDDEENPKDKAKQAEYLLNIKNSLQLLSNQLWRATKSQFYIDEIDVIAPSSWDLTGTEFETNRTAEKIGTNNAEIRVSPFVTHPITKNPHGCGHPGEYIRLPLWFFETTNANKFGPSWKTLLVLFARYRYGVWEEHGIVGHLKYPYIVSNPDTSELTLTGCSDVPLIGKFVQGQNASEECDPENPNSCRFLPSSRENTATSSLMHLHWIESVVDFCDEGNHNSMAENRHNMLCNGKSVMRVIRESEDYGRVTQPLQTQIPPIKLNVIKESPKALLYILLDRGQFQGDLEIGPVISSSLRSFLQSNDLKGAVGALASFPNLNNANLHVALEVGWASVEDNLNEFINKTSNLDPNGPIERDFSRAILSSRWLWVGVDVYGLRNTAPQAELITALNEHKAILHSIEVGVVGQLGSHVVPVAASTGGLYTTVSSPEEGSYQIENVINFAGRTVSFASIFIEPPRRTIDKRMVTQYSSYLFLPVPQNALRIDVLYSSAQRLTSDNFTISIDGEAQNKSVMRSTEYSMEDNSGFKYTYWMGWFSQELEGKRNIYIRMECDLPTSCGQIIGQAILPSGFDTEHEAIRPEVSVSSYNVDLKNQIPFTIYAEAVYGGVEVSNLIPVAEFTNSRTMSTYFVVLSDDGNEPDEMERDGIFSGYFVPPEDGIFDVVVRLQYSSFDRHTNAFEVDSQSVAALDPEMRVLLLGAIKETEEEGGSSRLFPPGEDNLMDCAYFNNCPMKRVPEWYMQVAELKTQVEFKNVLVFEPKPGKSFVMYLDSGTSAMLAWVSPRVPTWSAYIAATAFELRFSTSREKLMNNFEDCPEVEGDVPVPSGTGSFAFMAVDPPNVTTYYAVKSTYNGARSEISNIREVIVTMEDPEPTATTIDEDSTTTTTSSTTTPTTLATSTSQSSNPTPTGTTATTQSTPTTTATAAKNIRPLGWMTFTIVLSCYILRKQ